jgi:glycosyltransferase involved in cell wall biosynthesis
MELVSNPRPFVSLALQRAIRRLRPRAIIYLHRLTILALIRARYFKLLGRGCRTVFIDLQPSSLSPLSRILARWLWPDLLMVATERDRQAMAALGAHAGTISVATDLARFRPAKNGEKADIRRRWGLPLEADIVIHVGHLKTSRNLDRLIPIAQRPNTRVVTLVSREREPASQSLRTRLETAGVMVLDGYRPNVEEIYRAADCYVFPVDSSDGAIAMPLSVLEAMATDLPVVTTSYGTLPTHFGETVGVCFADSAEAILAAVNDQLRLRPSTRAAVEPYSWDAVIDRLV